jgi:Spy/CpxP family protein refolding chaperone
MIVVSGTGKTARYGCPQAWNRRACDNRVSFRARHLEQNLFQTLKIQLQSSAAVEYVVQDLLRAQERQHRSEAGATKTAELKAEIDRLVAAIAAVGHSEALLAMLQAKERELKALECQHRQQRLLTPEEVRAFVVSSFEDIPALLAKAPESAKAELSRRVDAIRLSHSEDGQIVLDGEWDLLGGNRGPVLVAGARFELATFGL